MSEWVNDTCEKFKSSIKHEHNSLVILEPEEQIKPYKSFWALCWKNINVFL